MAARWIHCNDAGMLLEFKKEQERNLALDSADNLTYLAPSRVSLDITMEKWPGIDFHETREH